MTKNGVRAKFLLLIKPAREDLFRAELVEGGLVGEEEMMFRTISSAVRESVMAADVVKADEEDARVEIIVLQAIVAEKDFAVKIARAGEVAVGEIEIVEGGLKRANGEDIVVEVEEFVKRLCASGFWLSGFWLGFWRGGGLAVKGGN